MHEVEEALHLADASSLTTLRRRRSLDADAFAQPGHALFLSLERQWGSAACGEERAGPFLGAVAACELHSQLLGYVLQLHARDALDMLEELAQGVIKRQCCAWDETEAVEPVVEALAASAVVTADSVDGLLGERRGELQRRLQAAIGTVRHRISPLQGALALLMSDGCGRDAESWRAFEALPFEPSNLVVSSTRSGRSRAQAMSGVLRQQQKAMPRRFLGRDEDDCVRDTDSDALGGDWSVADRLWKVAHALLTWIEERTALAGGLGEGGVEADSVSHEGAQIQDALLTEADLEAYLRSKTHGPEQAAAIGGHEPPAGDSPPTLHPVGLKSRIQELLEACTSKGEVCDEALPDGLLTAAHAELAAISDLERLRVQASYILAYQLEAGCAFAQSSRPEVLGLERLVQRELNSLTDDRGKTETHLRALVALAPFCPRRLLELVVREASTDSMHHDFYLNLLAACPLLTNWEDRQSQSSGEVSVLKRELRRMMVETTSSTGQLEEQGRHVAAFLLGLTSVAEHPPPRHPILPLSELLRDVLLAQLRDVEAPPAGLPSDLAAFNAFSLTQQFLGRVVASCPSNSPSLGSSGVELLQRTAEAYAAVSSSTTRVGTQFREVLLLLAKDVLEAFVMADSLPSALLSAALVPPIGDTLSSDAAFTALIALVRSHQEDSFAPIPRKQSGEVSGSAPDVLPLDQATKGAQDALWRIVWASRASPKLASHAAVSVSELWESIDNLATWTSVRDSNAFASDGASVIQSAAASVLLSCGEALTRTFRDSVVPFLMKYEEVDVSKRGTEALELPCTRDSCCSPTPDRLECSLASTHCVARYFVKCWSLMMFKHYREHPELLAQMLRGVLSACDSAAKASAGSSTQLLACLQWECYLAFSAHELGTDAESSWSAVSAQLEMSLLRILHGLSQFSDIPAADAAATTRFMAAWLSVLPSEGSFAAVFRYLQAKRDTVE